MSPMNKNNANPIENFKSLLERLAREHWIAPESAKEAWAQHTRNPVADEHPLETAFRIGLKDPSGKDLSQDALCDWYCSACGFEHYRIDPLKIDMAAVTDMLSANYAKAHGILPVEIRGNLLLVASANPANDQWIAQIQPYIKKSIKPVFSNPLHIRKYCAEFYALAKSVKTAQTNGSQNNLLRSFEQIVEMGKDNRNVDANDAHVTKIVDWLWAYAFEQRASDIHFEPRREMGIVRFRIDGSLHQVYQMPAQVMQAAVNRIKLLGRMDMIEKRKPQDGRIKTVNSQNREIELRLSTLPTAFGEKLVMRIFDPEVLSRDFESLGFNSEELAQWNEMTSRPNGIILVTGPTGSGKTTTLYATLRRLSTPDVNVCTVEDPIEMIDPTLNQMQVQPAIEIGFAEGLRALMRQDPDVIMVGEIRDRQTADMAIQAALTGHLVLSTLHTNDAPGSVNRLLDLGAAPYLVSASLIGVLAQRLARTLCPHCKVARPFSSQDKAKWDRLAAPFSLPCPESIFHSPGCIECRNTGYKGRVGLYELMSVNAELKDIIISNPSIVALQNAAYQNGTEPLRISGLKKIALGLCDFDEISKVVPPPEKPCPPKS